MFKKINIFALSLILAMVFASPSMSAVGIKVDGTLQGTATDIGFKSEGTKLSNDGSTWTFNLLLAGVGSSGATSMATNEVAVPVSYSFVRKAISTNDPAYLAGTMADGYPGQLLTLFITTTYGGTYVLTPTTKTGYTSISFNAGGDFATFLYVDDTYGWVIIATNSVTVTSTEIE